MTTYQFAPGAVRTLCDLMVVHRRFRSSLNPESVYVLYGLRRENRPTLVYRAELVPNSHPEPVEGFQVRRDDLEMLTATVHEDWPWQEVVGVLHTHEDRATPGPSAEDMEGVVHDHLHGILCPYASALVFYDQDGAIARFDLYMDQGTPKFTNQDGLPLLGTTITEGHETT